jgi:cholesterol transport system auxiliary component
MVNRLRLLYKSRNQSARHRQTRRVTIRYLILPVLCLLSGCAVKNPITRQYQLNAFSAERVTSTPSDTTLLITPTEAVNAYQTEQMQYSTQLYALSRFGKTAWISPPATMLYPLLVQSVQGSGYFYAVSAGAYMSKTTYRLDTQLLKLQQNFTKKPSVLEFKIKAVLTRVIDNQIIASRIFNENINCPQDTPYGGVLAANIATQKLTKRITNFVVAKVKTASS